MGRNKGNRRRKRDWGLKTDLFSEGLEKSHLFITVAGLHHFSLIPKVANFPDRFANVVQCIITTVPLLFVIFENMYHML